MASTNTDDVFEADVNAQIRAQARARSHPQRTRPQSQTKGPSPTLYEHTPLLERDLDDHRDSSDDASHHGTERSALDWSGARDFEGRPWWRKPSIFWLLPPFLLATLAFGGIIVPKVNLILSLICREYLAEQRSLNPAFHIMPVLFGTENPQCRIPAVQSRVSQFTLYGNVITGLLSAVTSPKLGAISDRYGRTRMIAFVSSGMLVTEVITILAARMPETFSVNWLFLGFAFDGLSGSFVASMALTNAYVSDCTPPGRRNVSFGYFHGVLFTGIALGPLLAGYVVKWTGTIVSVFYIAVAAHAFFALFVLLVVPESLTKERQKAAREKVDFVGVAEGLSMTSVSWGKSMYRKYNFLAPLKAPTTPSGGI
ncbi:MAG: hypothetical protein Q9168_008092 [Polycauliona sp. 1 TL-2023]